MPRPPAYTGITYLELLDWVRSVENTWDCHIHYELHPPVKRSLGFAWNVRVVARWYGVGAKLLREMGSGGQFPCNNHSTLVGLKLALLNDLDRKIQEAAQEQARAQLGQLRLADF
jgi:hypothetical protein